MILQYRTRVGSARCEGAGRGPRARAWARPRSAGPGRGVPERHAPGTTPRRSRQIAVRVCPAWAGTQHVLPHKDPPESRTMRARRSHHNNRTGIVMGPAYVLGSDVVMGRIVPDGPRQQEVAAVRVEDPRGRRQDRVENGEVGIRTRGTGLPRTTV